jgi:hypothetical protein
MHRQNHSTINFDRAFVASLVGAGLVAACAGPAAADYKIAPRGPIITQPIVKLKPDLKLEALSVTPQGTGWLITATLKNTLGEYPGGGQFLLTRSSGGTSVPEPSANPNDPWLIFPDQGTKLASKPIPKMSVGQTLSLSALSAKRGIFRAEAASIGPSGPDMDDGSPVDDANSSNNSMQVNKLIPKTSNLDVGWVGAYLDVLTSSIRIKLDRYDAYTQIVGFPYESHFAAPEVLKYLGNGVTGHWRVSSVNYQSGVKGVADNRLNLGLTFEKNGAELSGYATGPGAPEAEVESYDADPIQVSVSLPLTYQAGIQLIGLGAPVVSVNAPLKSLPGSMAFLQTDFNNKLRNAVQDMFANESAQRWMEYQLNKKVREQMLKGYGRITGVEFNGYLSLHTEVAE